jgi:hypothetical protein
MPSSRRELLSNLSLRNALRLLGNLTGAGASILSSSSNEDVSDPEKAGFALGRMKSKRSALIHSEDFSPSETTATIQPGDFVPAHGADPGASQGSQASNSEGQA